MKLLIHLALLLSLMSGFVHGQWQIDRAPVVVALIDSGLQLDHPQLANRLWTNPLDGSHGWDFVDGDNDPTDPCYGHGTATAGVLAEATDGRVQFMVLRVLGCGGTATEQRLVDAIQFAVDNGAQVIQAIVLVSSAWGVPGWDQPNGLPGLRTAIQDSGLLTIVPAGNEGVDLALQPRYPAAFDLPNLLTVGAIDMNAAVTSNFGTPVPVFAPGVDIVTTVQSAGNPLWSGDPSGFMAVDGSSFAAPQALAVACRTLDLAPQLDGATLRDRVLETVDSDQVLRAFWRPAETTPPPPPPGPSSALLELASDGSDLSGTGNDLACSSCPAGTAFTNDWFFRSDSQLIGNFPSRGATEFTIDAWVDLNDLSDRQPIASKQGGGERGWVFLASPYIGGRLRFECWPAGGSAVRLDGTTPLNGVHRVTVTRDAAGIARLYVDGVEEASQAMPPPRDNNQPLDIGRYFWSSAYARYLDGELWGVRFFDRALTPAELQ